MHSNDSGDSMRLHSTCARNAPSNSLQGWSKGLDEMLHFSLTNIFCPSRVVLLNQTTMMSALQQTAFKTLLALSESSHKQYSC